MKPVKKRLWISRCSPPSPDLVAAVQAAHRLSPLVARLLLSRAPGIPEAEQFLETRLADLPDPRLLPDMSAAVARLSDAILGEEAIAIHGDYDVDGITGTSLLTEGLHALGAVRVSPHIPLRLRDGYGLSAEAMAEAAAQGVQVVVSVDCGVSAHHEAKIARERGLDLIITDHHQPPDQLPEALAIVNPHRRDSLFPFRDLSGVGVAFFLLIALRGELRQRGWFSARAEPDLRCLLDLVALGTIADMVPLQGVNRTLARQGLALMEQGRRPGIKALMQVAGIRNISAGNIGFQVAPRLNAAGRLEDANLGVELLLENDLLKAMVLARQLDQCNRHRQEIERQTLAEAETALSRMVKDQAHAIVLAAQGWHPGVIGIVASRLVERYHRPTVMIALDGQSGKGSARSIRGFHLFRGLEACAGHLETFGGHEMAAGLCLSADQIADFTAAFDSYVQSVMRPEDLIPRQRHDGDVRLEELDLAVGRQLSRLAPFGIGNPEPLLVVSKAAARQIQVLNQRHLRFTTVQGRCSHPAMAFGMADRREEFAGPIDLLVSPQINRFRGQETLQLKVKDVRPSAEREKD